MNNSLAKYLSARSFTQPLEVDRLIISAFISVNNIIVKKNTFIKEYLISDKNLQEFESLSNFILKIKQHFKKFGVEQLIELFEFVISPKDRIVTGAVYTPAYIRNYIVDQTFSNSELKSNSTIADISCGCGGFLYTAAIKIKKNTNKSYYQIFKNQIFGLDIQEYSIARTKLLLSLLAISEGEDKEEFEFNLYTGDALDFEWKGVIKNYTGFDKIVGNPPYVCSRHLDENTKLKLAKWEVCKSGHPDLYIPFFQIAIENLNESGILGFITMNTFFKSLNGRALRQYFQHRNLRFKIIDFGTEQIFKSKYTYTCICFIELKDQKFVQYYESNNSKELPKRAKLFSKINYSNLDVTGGWNFKNRDLISKIECCGNPFGQLYKTRNGIATLKNQIYIFDPIKEDNNYYYLQNGSVFKIEKEICRNIINSNKINATNKISNIKQKIIFPYTDDDKPKLLAENYLRQNFPYAYEYLDNKKQILATRDKGKGKYEKWFAFGRNQSLEKIKFKLFFPHLTNDRPYSVISSDDHLLFYNGLAAIAGSEIDLLIIKKLMQSKLFWFYVKNTSKPYTSGYFSLSRAYIKNFGVCQLTNDEKEFVLNESRIEALDEFFEMKYDILLPTLF
jgi:adenine-specific DNA-methyltransferase